MSRKRPGLRSADKTFAHLTRELRRSAIEELKRNIASDFLDKVNAAILELKQLHTLHYPECDGGCPAIASIADLQSIAKQLEPKQ
jgi:hypothetical protein